MHHRPGAGAAPPAARAATARARHHQEEAEVPVLRHPVTATAHRLFPASNTCFSYSEWCLLGAMSFPSRFYHKKYQKVPCSNYIIHKTYVFKRFKNLTKKINRITYSIQCIVQGD